MGKTFVEDERPCDQCVNRTRYGCASWDCKFIDRDEAIKAWKEKHERKDEPQAETEMERLERIDNEIEDAWARIRELTDEPQTDCAWK